MIKPQGNIKTYFFTKWNGHRWPSWGLNVSYGNDFGDQSIFVSWQISCIKLSCICCPDPVIMSHTIREGVKNAFAVSICKEGGFLGPKLNPQKGVFCRDKFASKGCFGGKKFFLPTFCQLFFFHLFTPTKCLKGLKSRKSLFVSKF